MLVKIKNYFEYRKQIKAMKNYTTLSLYTLMTFVTSIIDDKEELINGTIALLKSFNGMSNEDIQTRFYSELVKYIHETNPNKSIEK